MTQTTEDKILPMAIDANDEGGYNAVVFVNGEFTLRTFMVQTIENKEIPVWEDIVGAPDWRTFVKEVNKIVTNNPKPKSSTEELVEEYRSLAHRMNEIARELGHEHNVDVDVAPVPHSKTTSRGYRLEYSYLNPVFKKVM